MLEYRKCIDFYEKQTPEKQLELFMEYLCWFQRRNWHLAAGLRRSLEMQGVLKYRMEYAYGALAFMAMVDILNLKYGRLLFLEIIVAE